MLTPVREMPEPERRRHQQNLGLVVVTRRSDPPQTEKRKRMDETTTRTQTPRTGMSRAAQTLERMTEAPTFKEVALHELKRASVYVPMLFSAGVGLLWLNKRFFLKVG